MKINQYRLVHIKVIYWISQSLSQLFEIYTPEIYEMFVYKHTEMIEYVKK